MNSWLKTCNQTQTLSYDTFNIDTASRYIWFFEKVDFASNEFTEFILVRFLQAVIGNSLCSHDPVCILLIKILFMIFDKCYCVITRQFFSSIHEHKNNLRTNAMMHLIIKWLNRNDTIWIVPFLSMILYKGLLLIFLDHIDLKSSHHAKCMFRIGIIQTLIIDKTS